jgi:branched-chain amino acid transport system substrate-binding protein
VPIVIQAERHSGLSSVKWYGSDGSALNEGLVKNVDASKFAVSTSFANPIYAVDDESNSRFSEVSDHVTKEIGHPHRSYAEVAYDALWVAALTLEQERENKTSNENETLSKTLFKVAESFDGITGKTMLNDAGDRIAGSYDLWAVREENGGSSGSEYEWKRIETFHGVN